MNPNTDLDAHIDADTSTDADADADSDTDSDSDAGTNSDTSDLSIGITAFAHDVVYDAVLLYGEPILLSEDDSDSDMVSESGKSSSISMAFLMIAQ